MFWNFLLAVFGFTLFLSSLVAFVLITVRYVARALASMFDPKEYLRNWFLWGLVATFLTFLMIAGWVLLAIARDFAFHWLVILIGVLLTVVISACLWRIWRIYFGHNSAGVGW